MGTEQEADVLVFVGPTDVDRKRLVDQFGINEHTLNCALDPDELSRTEQDDTYLAMIFKRPTSYSATDRFLFKISSVGTFLFANKLIVVVAEDMPLFDGRLFNKVTSVRDVVLRMIYRSIQHFIEHIRVINMISLELESQIQISMHNRKLINMFTLEKSLVYYLSAIQGNGALIDRLRMNAANKSMVGFSEENIELIDDLAIENRQCYEQTRIHSDILGGLMDARASIVNNNLNLMMRTLTLMMIALMWPPLVCGFLSMNVRLPVDHSSLYPFGVVVLLALGPLFAGLMWWWQRVKRARTGR